MTEVPTTSQVNKAGRTLRRHARGDGVDFLDLSHALDVLLAYRASHATPLQSATMGLRSMVRTEGCEVQVSQRLKRVPTIIDKLSREPTLALSRMQDIGGCRAILDSVDEIRRLEARIRKRRPIRGVSDYVVQPRSSGYRGVHVIVEYHDRAIEVQLRTKIMHEWAVWVERLTWTFGQNFKQDGEHAVQRWLAAVSAAMAHEEAGEAVPPVLLAQISDLRLHLSELLIERRGSH